MNAALYTSLQQADPEIHELIERETYRQWIGLELIASENLTSRAVFQSLGSFLTNKYSEGVVGHRYYGGNEIIDKVETLCQERALAAFHLDPTQFGVNVQPYSGTGANFAAFTALLQPGDRIMGLGLPDGGHLSHGFYTAKKKMTASSIFFQSLPYQVNRETGLIDYDTLESQTNLFKPKLIICGASAYPRDWDYKRLRTIADQHGAYLLADIAHTSGLIASQLLNNPFEFADIVTTTTHKTLRGPRAGLIFYKLSDDMKARVDGAVFPATQGGPHNNTIAAIAVALKQAMTPEFKQYAKAIIENAQTIAKKLMEYGYDLQTDGTDNHLILWNLKKLGLTGSKVETVADMCHITLNKNSVVGDVSAVAPGGVRVGTAALTSRDMGVKEMEQVAEYLHRVVQLSLKLQEEAGSKLIKDFVRVATVGESPLRKEIASLKADVQAFAKQFPLPGIPDVSDIKHFADMD